MCTQQSLTLTGMSYVEQNRAGSEAEVGNVGPEFKPLETRGKIRECYLLGTGPQTIEQKNDHLHNTVISPL